MARCPDLGSVQADDAVHVPGAVIKVGHGDGMLAGGDPVLFGVGVDLEDVGSGAEDRLLSEEKKEGETFFKNRNLRSLGNFTRLSNF